jgi:hypothetical protein
MILIGEIQLSIVFLVKSRHLFTQIK